MGRFVARRLLLALPQLVAVALLTFVLVDMAPGDFGSVLCEDPRVPRDECARWERAYGLDRPLGVRFAAWLGRAARGDLGWSLEYRRPVASLVAERLASTLALALAAMALAWGIAVPLGVLSASRPGSRLDRACALVAYVGLSIPVVLLSLLVLLFAARTGLLPIGGTTSAGHEALGPIARLLDRAWHLAAPAAVLALGAMAGYLRQTRASMIDALREDFVRTARAKGASAGAVLWRHAFRNAVNPLVTLFGYSLGFLLNGSFLVEYVLGWPGMARLTVDALLKQDEPLVVGSVVVAGALLVAGNLVADLLLAASDPRIRLEQP